MSKQDRDSATAITKGDRKLVDEALLSIQGIFVRGMVDTVLATGQYLLDTFFDGDPAVYRERKKNSPSFNALCERHEALAGLGLSRSKLYRCVMLHIQYEEMNLEALKDLPVAHQAAMLPAPAEQKEALLKQVLDEHLTSQEITARVQAMRSGKGGVGRPRKPALAKALGRIHSVLESMDEPWFDEIKGVGTQAVSDALKTAKGCREDLDDLIATLENVAIR